MNIPVKVTPPRRTQGERCDCCGFAAFGGALIGGVWLFFCGHHFTQHEEALYGVATDVVDDREHINIKPSQAATV